MALKTLRPFVVFFENRKCIDIQEFEFGDKAQTAVGDIITEDVKHEKSVRSAVMVYAQDRKSLERSSPYYKIGEMLPEDLDDGFTTDLDR